VLFVYDQDVQGLKNQVALFPALRTEGFLPHTSPRALPVSSLFETITIAFSAFEAFDHQEQVIRSIFFFQAGHGQTL
jgi:hypothetical protein